MAYRGSPGGQVRDRPHLGLFITAVVAISVSDGCGAGRQFLTKSDPVDGRRLPVPPAAGRTHKSPSIESDSAARHEWTASPNRLPNRPITDVTVTSDNEAAPLPLSLPPSIQDSPGDHARESDRTPEGRRRPARTKRQARNQPAPVAPPEDPIAELRKLVHKGESELTSRTSYRVGLRRQERVGETLQPEEVVLVNIRREPLAVRLEWPEGPNKGREVIYDKSGDGLMHINMPGAIVPRMSLATDSPMVVRSSRHPIQDAGLETVLQELAQTLERHASRQIEPGETLHDGGVQSLDPDRVPCRKIIQRNAKGETWTVGLDPSTGLPLLVLGLAPNGDLLERHQFFKYESNPPDLAEATAFVPSKRWGEAKGLIPRLPLNLLSGQPVAPGTERK